jgi:cation:H+ antiporter
VGAVLLLAASFAVILAGAMFFTNAVEWAGHRLAMGQGAVGSLLAAAGTAMPETLIPIVAVIDGADEREGVAIGAIIGAPFLLATIAMMLVGLSALAYRNRRSQGTGLRIHAPTLERDLVFFAVFFACAQLLGLGAPPEVRTAMALVFVGGYVWYVRMTLRSGGRVQEAETIGPLIMARTGRPGRAPIALQFFVGLAAMIGGAHLFVEQLVEVADSIGVEALVLSLVLAPLATELPEKANSFFWVREGKDALALGNITGAMVFQSTLPVAFGMTFTAWDLDSHALLSAGLGLLGAGVAYWALRLRQRFSMTPVLAWGALYAVFPLYVILS